MEINNNIVNTSLPNSEIKKNNTSSNKSKENLQIKHMATIAEKVTTLPADIKETFESIIKSSGLRVTPDTLKMLQSLIDNKLPLNNTSVQNLNKAIKLFNILENTKSQNETSLNANLNKENTTNTLENNMNKSQSSATSNTASINTNMFGSMDKAIFLLNNEIPVTTSNTYILQNMLEGQGHIGAQLSNLANSIDSIDNIEIKNSVIEALLKNHSAQLQPNTISETNATLKNLQDISQLDLNNFPENIKENLSTENIIRIEQSLSQNTLTMNSLNEILKPNIPITANDIFTMSEILFANNPDSKESFLLKLSDGLQSSLTNQTNENISKAITNLAESILNRFSIDFDSTNPKDIDKVLNELNQNLADVETLLSKSSYTNILENISTTRENLEFLNLLKDSIYIPLPISLGETTTNGELFIFKDSRRSKKSKSSSSALVALNTAYLGRVETYIQKHNNNINLQFRLENMETQSIIKSNINTLNSLLREYNYNLQSFSLTPIGTPFNVLGKEPALQEDLTESTTSLPTFNLDIKT